jgi:hypothetical protein
VEVEEQKQSKLSCLHGDLYLFDVVTLGDQLLNPENSQSFEEHAYSEPRMDFQENLTAKQRNGIS